MLYRTIICVGVCAALTAPAGATGLDVTFFVTSDTHLGFPGTDENNAVQIAAMNGLPGTPYPASIGGVVDTPTAVLVSGDLTESSQQPQWDDFVAGYGLDGTDGTLNYPVYECPGNHDIRSQVVPNGIVARHGSEVFEVDFGPLYLSSVGLYPNSPNVSTLKQNLVAVGFDRPILLFHHYGFDPFSIDGWWADSERAGFRSVIDGYNVIAIFHGHSHIPDMSTWQGYDVFVSGSAKGTGGQNAFVVVRVTLNTLTAAMYRWTKDGNGQWNGGSWVSWLTRAISVPQPPADCNNNGVPDDQDIADATSADANGNGYPDECEPPVLYVDQDATSGRNVGTGWADAFTDLQDALAIAEASGGLVEEIWVTEGTYTPNRGTTERRRTFQLLSGVAILGGFAGSETTREERDIAAHATTLSGEINTAGIKEDNSYHVVTARGVDATAVLDGFRIIDGFANANGPPHTRGAGLYNDGGSPTLANCVFRDNEVASVNLLSPGTGAGMYSKSGNPMLINCAFFNNTAQRGGALEIESGNPTLINATVHGNVATGAFGVGGGIHVSVGSPTLVNCILWGNTAGFGNVQQAQITGGTPDITYSCVQDDDPDDAAVLPGAGNLDDDPLFADAAGGNLRLSEGSPCLDTGKNSVPGLPDSDLDGNPRIANGTIDMGAYELQAAASVPMLSHARFVGLVLWVLALGATLLHIRRTERRPAC